MTPGVGKTGDSGAFVEQNQSMNRRDLLGSSAAAFVALVFGGTAEAAARRAGNRHADPRFALADRLADLVIPATDTPGASEAGVGSFLLMALDEKIGSMEPEQLARVGAALDVAAGGAFLNVPRDRQEALLEALDARAFAGPAAASTAEGDWPHLKGAILAGYYTSEIGASRELTFDPVPGTRENITLTPEFRAPSNPGFGGAL